MKLVESEALGRLAAHNHGVLSTVHPERGVDAVPVVYAVSDRFIGVPVDRIKPKASMRLQRHVNLEADPRASLLIEQWDQDDWSKLWWVRAHLRYEETADGAVVQTLTDQLAEAFTQYQDKPFSDMLILRIEAVTGWAASDS